MADKIVNTRVKTQGNKVDQLLFDIQAIQESCKHEFQLKSQLTIQASLVEEVSRVQEFVIICVKCSLEEETSSAKNCPRCLHQMPKFAVSAKKFQNWGDEMKSYFGGSQMDHSYYAPVLYKCPNCLWEVVDQEWDQ